MTNSCPQAAQVRLRSVNEYLSELTRIPRRDAINQWIATSASISHLMVSPLFRRMRRTGNYIVEFVAASTD